MPTAIATISRSALHHNYQRVRQLAPGCSIVAMVKANAYGHGLITVAQALPDVEALGVSHTQEALTLRDAGIRQRILVMGGFHDPAELHALCKARVDAVVHQLYQTEMLEQQQLSRPIPIWLKINTGMHRIGFSPESFFSVSRRLAACHQVQQPFNILTHFSDADDQSSDKTSAQYELFKNLTENLPGEKSTANSAAILAYPDSHADWIRPGIMLYGIAPFADSAAMQHNLRPVMTLTSKLIAIHHLSKGAEVGYGSTYVCPEDMRVGVVAIGYGDGYPRHAISGTPVLVNGKRCALIGRVSMDMMSVDLRADANAQVGDEVILWGNDLPIEVVAGCAETIPYQLVTGITSRVRYVVS